MKTQERGMFDIVGASSGAGGLFVIEIVIYVAVAAFMWWKVFEKAGISGWWSLIPILNTYGLTQVARKPGWWVVLTIIPFVNIIVLILLAIGVSRAFGHGGWFAVGLFFLPIIFYPILGFGSSEYEKAAATPY